MAKSPNQILEESYKKSVEEFKKDKGKSFLESLDLKEKNWIEIIAKNSEKQKAVATALITSLTKKIETPSQDVRFHKVELPKGYSGRSFDTEYITPFLKDKFPRIAMSESGWLTRSIEQAHPFTKDFPGKIRNKLVKEAFLEIINNIEMNKADPEKYLIALFILLLHEFSHIQTILRKTITPTKEMNIDLITNFLKSHFFAKYSSFGASRLPVIAVYSIYQIITKELARYQDKKLNPLRSHLAPDMRSGGIGDIEVIDRNGRYFEAVEIKHGKQITIDILKESFRKLKSTSVKRYYILTTAEPYINKSDEEAIKQFTQEIRKSHGCELIINGIIHSIKYYLRLIKNPEQFIEVYTNNLKIELSKGTEIKEEHVNAWLNILKYFVVEEKS